VNNAVDASGLGKRVQVRAMTGHRGRIQLQVIDEGVGINPEDRARIFDPYFTTKRHGREIRGFGLGLTIVQKIASLHGGAVTVESTPGQGATFTVDLPSGPPAASHAAPVVPVPT
jgi:two-component system NtrC family sensor kinase